MASDGFAAIQPFVFSIPFAKMNDVIWNSGTANSDTNNIGMNVSVGTDDDECG